MRNRLVIFSVILFAHLLTPPLSVFAYTKIKTFNLVAPEQVLPGVERIAVLDFVEESAFEDETVIESAEELGLKVLGEILFGGKKEQGSNVNHGRNFTDYLISDLILKDRGIENIKTGFLGMGKSKDGKTLQDGAFTNVFEVVERTQLEKILEEQALSASGAVNQEQVAQLGKLMGVQALVTGNISVSQKDSEYQESRTEKKDNKNITKKVDCQKREVKVNVRVRIVSTETGKILGSTKSEESINKSHCDDAWGSLPSADEMIDECLQKNVERIVNYFSPYYELVENEFEKIEVEKYKDLGDKAAKQAEELKVDEAYVLYHSIFQKEQYNPEVMYNLGILHEVVGNYDEAGQMYNMAFQLDNNDRYKNAVKRIEKNIEFANALSAMGIELVGHSFEVTPNKVARALAKKVKTNGDRNDKINIHEQPTAQSSLVARVPGGLTFTVLGQKDEWFLIELLDGKQGYVKNDACKLVD